MNTPSFEEKILSALNMMLPSQGASVLVSFSGGPDSTALLHFLSTMKSRFLLNVSALYVDHGMRSRKELDTELLLIQQQCRGWGVELFIESVPSGEIVERSLKERRSSEELAREYRYGFLKKYESSVDCIALGHIQDDVVETLVMRFFQGSGWEGLKGIPSVRGPFIRPLLDCTKQEVYAYLAREGISFSIDSTNREVEYLRNKVRHRLIPLIEEVFPGYRHALSVFSRKMGMAAELVERQLSGLEEPVPCDGGYYFPLASFIVLPSAVKLSFLYRMFHKVKESGGQVPFRFFSPLLEAEEEVFPALRGYGIHIFKKDRWLFFLSDIVHNRKKGYLVVIDNVAWGQASGSERGFLLREIIKENSFLTLCIKGKEIDSPDEEGVVLNPDFLKWPLIIRSRKKGDKIQTGRFSQSLKKIYNEWKVKEEFRAVIPVLEDRSGIVGIIGKPFGYKNLAGFLHNKNKLENYKNFIEILVMEIKIRSVE